MKCPVCHSRIPDDASYCPNCRTRLNNASAGGQFEELESEETVLMGNKSASRHSKKGAAPRRNGSSGFDFSVMDHSYLSHDKLTREEVENMDKIHKKKIGEFENTRVPVHVSRFVPTGMMPDAEYGNVLQRRQQQQQNASVSYSQADNSAAAQPAYSSDSQRQAQPSYKDRAKIADGDTGSPSGGKPKKKKGLIIGIVCAVVVAALAIGAKCIGKLLEEKATTTQWTTVEELHEFDEPGGKPVEGQAIPAGTDLTITERKDKDEVTWIHEAGGAWLKAEEKNSQGTQTYYALQYEDGMNKTYKVMSNEIKLYAYPIDETDSTVADTTADEGNVTKNSEVKPMSIGDTLTITGQTDPRYGVQWGIISPEDAKGNLKMKWVLLDDNLKELPESSEVGSESEQSDSSSTQSSDSSENSFPSTSTSSSESDYAQHQGDFNNSSRPEFTESFKVIEENGINLYESADVTSGVRGQAQKGDTLKSKPVDFRYFDGIRQWIETESGWAICSENDMSYFEQVILEE